MQAHKHKGSRPAGKVVLRRNDDHKADRLGETEYMESSPTPVQYHSLRQVLEDAYNQAAYGKGAQRHGDDRPFHEQQYCRDLQDLGIAAGLYQIRKKALEASRMDNDAAYRELLGVIVYAAGVCIELNRG